MAAFLPPPDHLKFEEEKEDAGTRWWQCLRAVGRQWNMTRGGAEGVGQGKWEADDTTRGGRGQTMRGKRAAEDTTRGSSSQQQKMVEHARAGVCLC
jgi:hypothetical protein